MTLFLTRAQTTNVTLPTDPSAFGLRISRLPFGPNSKEHILFIIYISCIFRVPPYIALEEETPDKAYTSITHSTTMHQIKAQRETHSRKVCFGPSVI